MDTTATSTTNLLEAWTSPRIRASAFAGVLARARPRIPTLEDGLIHIETVHEEQRGPRDLESREPTYHRIDLLAARSVQPHVDPDFEPWTVLVTLEHGEGHALHVADHVPRGTSGMGRVPRTKPMASVTLEPGLITLFNGHLLHWLPRIRDRRPLVATSFSFAVRPEREAVEARILESLTSFEEGQRHAA